MYNEDRIHFRLCGPPSVVRRFSPCRVRSTILIVAHHGHLIHVRQSGNQQRHLDLTTAQGVHRSGRQHYGNIVQRARAGVLQRQPDLEQRAEALDRGVEADGVARGVRPGYARRFMIS